MRFEEKIGLVTLSAFVVASLFFIDYQVYDPMTLERVGVAAVYSKLISVAIVSVILLILTYFVYSFYKISNVDIKQEILDILLTLVLLTIAILIGLIRPLDLLLTGNTGIKITFITERYIDPISIAIGTVFLNMSFYYYLLYARWYTKTRGQCDFLFVILYAIGDFFIIHPSNFYSNSYEPVTFVKVASRVFLLIGMLIPVLIMIIGGSKKLKKTTSKITRARIWTLLISNIMILITLILNVIDALTETPYSSVVYIAYVLEILGIIGIGISIIAPRWYLSLIEKIY